MTSKAPKVKPNEILSGGWIHSLRYNFFVRIAWMVAALIALMAVTICTYQGTENLIEVISYMFSEAK